MREKRRGVSTSTTVACPVICDTPAVRSCSPHTTTREASDAVFELSPAGNIKQSFRPQQFASLWFSWSRSNRPAVREIAALDHDDMQTSDSDPDRTDRTERSTDQCFMPTCGERPTRPLYHPVRDETVPACAFHRRKVPDRLGRPRTTTVAALLSDESGGESA